MSSSGETWVRRVWTDSTLNLSYWMLGRPLTEGKRLSWYKGKGVVVGEGAVKRFREGSEGVIAM